MGSSRIVEENVSTTTNATIDATAKAVGKKEYPGVRDALNGVTDSEFALARAYENEVAPGMKTVKQADYDSMAAWLKRNKVRVPAYNTMRAQRAVAVFWPDTAIMSGVGFSIHRELMSGNKTYRQAKTMARAIADKQGKGSPLSVITIDAIRVHTGRARPKTSAQKKNSNGKAQAGTNAIPVIPATGTATEIATGIRSLSSKLTRAKLGDLTNDEIEGLSTLVNGLAKRIQSEMVARAKQAKAAKAPTEAKVAEKVTRARVQAKVEAKAKTEADKRKLASVR